MLVHATFSITARCARSGAFGIAVATRVPAVGAAVPHIRAGVGVRTRSWTRAARPRRLSAEAETDAG